MATWSTLHIHQNGETILIENDSIKSVLSLELTKVQAVIDNLYSFNAEEITETKKYHIISIIKNDVGIWISKKGMQWNTEYAKLDIEAIEELVAEIKKYGELVEEVVVSEETSAAE